jgi:hypothetical protein
MKKAELFEELLKLAIREAAKRHSEKYIDRYKKVAYDSFLAGMEAMSELMER